MNYNRGQALWASPFNAFLRASFREKREQRAPPPLIIGDPGETLQTVATEWYLKFGVDFGTGYSPGLFLDQRENRRYVRNFAPKTTAKLLCLHLLLFSMRGMQRRREPSTLIFRKNLSRVDARILRLTSSQRSTTDLLRTM